MLGSLSGVPSVGVDKCINMCHPYGKDANGNANGDKGQADLSFQVQPVPPEGECQGV